MRTLWVVPSLVLYILLLRRASALDHRLQTSSCSAELVEKRHADGSRGVRLPLHHVHGPCSPVRLPTRTSSSELLELDDRRVEALVARLRGTTAESNRSSRLGPEAASSPLSSGIPVGAGDYITTVRLGTPAVPMLVIVDTGSSMNWVQCQPCVVSCHPQDGPIFNPTASATYASVACSSSECTTLQPSNLSGPRCSRRGLCLYEVDYGDGSYSVGYVSKDTLNFAGTVVPKFVFGCGQENAGLFGRSAGLIGLSRNKLSILRQLEPTFGNVFSYCLPTVAGTGGHLTFGPPPSSEYVFTPLPSQHLSLDQSLYYLELTDIVVGGQSISLPSNAYARNPTIIDSGTVISRIPSDIYQALSTAVVSAMPNWLRTAPPLPLFDTCYIGSYRTLQLPTVQMVFAGNATISLPPKNVFYDFTQEGISCLAFARSTRIAIIGNHQHQTLNVVYDVGNSRIGFAPGGCS